MAPSAPAPRLVADVGGTNARMGWQAAPGAEITDVKVYPCADYPALQAVIEAYLRDLQRPAPAECAIGIACPVIGDQVRAAGSYIAPSGHVGMLGTQIAAPPQTIMRLPVQNAIGLPLLRMPMGAGGSVESHVPTGDCAAHPPSASTPIQSATDFAG